MATDPSDWHHVDVAASARDLLRAGRIENRETAEVVMKNGTAHRPADLAPPEVL